MLWRILIVTLSLSLLVPTCSPDDGTSRSAQVQEKQETSSAKEAAAPGSPQPLSPEEDASLSARAEEPGPEVSGGALSNLHLTYAVIALAAIILVLLVK
jgi:hypothetical protein